MDKWKFDPNYINAYLSILVRYYEIFRDVYRYDLGKVPHTQIRNDTEEYFERQDPIARFIKCKLIYVGKIYPTTGELVDKIEIKDIFREYKNWYLIEYGQQLQGHNTTHCNNFEKNYKLHNYLEIKRINGDNITYLKEYVLVDTEQNYDSIYSDIFNIDKILKSNDKNITLDEKLDIIHKQKEIAKNKISNIMTEQCAINSTIKVYEKQLEKLSSEYNNLLSASIEL